MQFENKKLIHTQPECKKEDLSVLEHHQESFCQTDDRSGREVTNKLEEETPIFDQFGNFEKVIKSKKVGSLVETKELPGGLRGKGYEESEN